MRSILKMKKARIAPCRSFVSSKRAFQRLPSLKKLNVSSLPNLNQGKAMRLPKFRTTQDAGKQPSLKRN
jgi:hypothetical protein